MGPQRRSPAPADQAYAPAHPYSLYVDDGQAGYLEGWATYAAGPLATEMGLVSEEARLVATDSRLHPGLRAGALELERLRAFAERELGPAFDLRAFHAQALSHGEIPLPALRRAIERWARGRPRSR